MRILELPTSDSQKIRSKKAQNEAPTDKKPQLNLFSTGRILKLHPKSKFEEALMLDERGEKQRAEKLYHEAIEAGDQPADAYCNLGIMEAQKGDSIEAINYLSLSLKFDPRHLEAHFNLANMYVKAGNLDLGILHYRIAIKINSGFTSSYFNLGLALAAKEEYHKAIAVFEQYQEVCGIHHHQQAVDMIRKLQNLIGA